jgi:hypothetical protein
MTKKGVTSYIPKMNTSASEQDMRFIFCQQPVLRNKLEHQLHSNLKLSIIQTHGHPILYKRFAAKTIQSAASKIIVTDHSPHSSTCPNGVDGLGQHHVCICLGGFATAGLDAAKAHMEKAKAAEGNSRKIE